MTDEESTTPYWPRRFPGDLRLLIGYTSALHARDGRTEAAAGGSMAIFGNCTSQRRDLRATAASRSEFELRSAVVAGRCDQRWPRRWRRMCNMARNGAVVRSRPESNFEKLPIRPGARLPVVQ